MNHILYNNKSNTKQFNNSADLTNEYLAVFLKKKIPTDILLKCICTIDHLPIQDFISSNLKDEFSWMTAISLIDSIDDIIDNSLGNRNISFEAYWKFKEGIFYLISHSDKNKILNKIVPNE